MRAFVAIPIDEPVKDALVRAVDRLKSAGADVRWVQRDTMHITVKFLGEIDEAQCERLRNLLRADAAKFRTLLFDVRGLGRFPPRGEPRTLWAGCRGTDLAFLTGLAGGIERAAEALGVARDPHPWNPHVTIGRLRSGRNARALGEQIAARGDEPFGNQTVRSFVLYKSTLTDSAPIYEAIETFTLGT